MAKPLIGVSCGLDPVRDQLVLPHDYAAALSAAGAMPILIPPLDQLQALKALCQRLDGVILSGGPDLSARSYGQANHPSMAILPPRRENWDLALAAELIAHSHLPLLGICLGCQEMNVAAGGTLYRHLPDDVPQALEHRRLHPPAETYHEVSLTVGGMLHELLHTNSLRCNSSHHQAAAALAPAFTPLATCRDGVIEAFGLKQPGTRFLLALQWHPERIWQQEPQRQLLQAMVRAC